MKNNRSGLIIMAVLWIIATLTIFALGIGYRTSIELRLSRYQIDKLKAFYAASAALQEVKQYLAIDLTNDTQNYDSLYNCGIYTATEFTPEKMFKDVALGDVIYTVKYKIGQDDENNPIWRYGLSDEESKININKADQATLKALLELAGADITKTESIAASIVDWRDEDSEMTSSYGAEDDYYQNLDVAYNCKNTNFDRLEELLLVKDVTPEIFNKIKDYLTIYGEGKVNINTASAVVLQALAVSAGLTSDSFTFANNIIDYRSGNDKIEATEDDNPCTTSANTRNYINDAEDSLVVELGVLTAFNNFISVKSTNFRAQIQAVSSDSKVIKNVTVVLDNSGKVQFWQEE